MELDYHVEESGRMWKTTRAMYCRELDIQGRDVAVEVKTTYGIFVGYMWTYL